MSEEFEEKIPPLSPHSTEVQKALSAMNAAKLPRYVIESFLATGYDTLHNISEIDVSEGLDNTLAKIESYINKNDKKIAATPNASDCKFEILPGHQHAVRNFVKQVHQQQVQLQKLSLKRKMEVTETTSKKREDYLSLKKKTRPHA